MQLATAIRCSIAGTKIPFYRLDGPHMCTSHLISSLLLGFALSTAHAQATYSLGGVALGDTKEIAAKGAPAAECYVHVNDRGVVDQEICELPDADMNDPIFFASGAKRSFHIANGRVSAFTILLPANMLNELAQRLNQYYGPFAPVASPAAKAKGKQNVAFLWQAKGAILLLDGEPAAAGQHGLVIAPARANGPPK